MSIGELATPLLPSVESFLLERQQTLSFTMVEMGHDAVPVAYQQPWGKFEGDRAYIGVEAWLRSPYNNKQKHLAELRSDNIDTDQNVFFLSIDAGGEVKRDSEEGDSWHEGEYDPTTILPADIADEVLISNVFCDPHIAYSKPKTVALLGEAARLVKTGGAVIMRETTTPQHTYLIKDELIESLGLKATALIHPGDKTNWQRLEEIYKGEPFDFGESRPDSYYLFLGRTAS